MTLVKICGLTTLADARCALEAGADMLGFIFYPKSPRYVTPAQAASIVRALSSFGDRLPRFVGVFVDEPPERVRAVVDAVGLDLVQLHGGESVAEVQALAPRAFKALRPQGLDQALEEVERYRPAFVDDDAVPQLLVDAYHPQHMGGTGTRADVSTAQALAGRVLLLLAGGLNPENVAGAVAQVRPWGVDVSSGVEASKGRKDHALVRAFVQAVKTFKGES